MAKETIKICVSKISSIAVQEPLVGRNPAERARASAISHVERRERFLKSRWLLRNLLGQALDVDPVSLEIVDKVGKPFLAGRNKKPQFSLSRSEDWVAVAIGLVPVGVDIEVVHAGGFDRDVADAFFHTVEIERVLACDEPDRTAAFYNHWTQKEAFVKATGLALGHDLKRFIVEPDGGPVTVLTEDAPNEFWHTHVLDGGEGVKLALATPIANPTIEWMASPQP